MNGRVNFAPTPPWLPKPVDFYCAMVFHSIQAHLASVSSSLSHWEQVFTATPISSQWALWLSRPSVNSSVRVISAPQNPVLCVGYTGLLLSWRLSAWEAPRFLASMSFLSCKRLLHTLSRKSSLSWPWVSSLVCFSVTDLILEKLCLTDKLKIITLG